MLSSTYSLFNTIYKYAELKTLLRYFKNNNLIIDSRDIFNHILIRFDPENEIIKKITIKNQQATQEVISVVRTGKHGIVERLEDGKLRRYDYLTEEEFPDIIQTYSSGFGYPDIEFDKGLTLIQEYKQKKTIIKSFADGFSKTVCEKALKKALEYKDDSEFEQFC